jgi:phosphoadenosine phosphosulfate reductase
VTTAATARDTDPEQAALEAAARELEDAAPQRILQWAVDRYRGRIALACSFGMQSVALIDMLARADLLADVEVFYLDTGVLFAQTHQTRLRIQARYGFEAVRVAPELSWEDQQARYDGHLHERGAEGVTSCCFLRKVQPMRRYFQRRGLGAWITGMRRSHSSRRDAVPVAMWDRVNMLAKFNPVAAMDTPTLWAYIKAHDVPYNPLYDQGYSSIGCDTPICTRPVAAGADGRDGRWVGTDKTECGIHVDGAIIRSMDSSKL